MSTPYEAGGLFDNLGDYRRRHPHRHICQSAAQRFQSRTILFRRAWVVGDPFDGRHNRWHGQVLGWPHPDGAATSFKNPQVDLRRLAETLAKGLTDQPWGQSLAALVGAAAHDDDIRSAQRDFNTRRRTSDRKIFERAVQRGEIDATLDIDTAVPDS